MQVFQIDASLPFARRACQSKAKAVQVTGAGFVVLLADVAGNRKQLAGLGAGRNAVFTEGLVLDLRNLRFDSQRVAGVVETTEFRTDRAAQAGVGAIADAKIVMLAVAWRGVDQDRHFAVDRGVALRDDLDTLKIADRKSPRLNSSH